MILLRNKINKPKIKSIFTTEAQRTQRKKDDIRNIYRFWVQMVFLFLAFAL
ncbi:MAG: hypothetical protein ACI9FJ_002383, partial [Alteromonadaceae bacterium]